MQLDRRTILTGALAAAATTALPLAPHAATTTALSPRTRPIPSSGEQMPIVGLGTWITFNVGNDPALLERSANVMRAFTAAGGRMIDTSPMYGSAQSTIGYGLKSHPDPQKIFSADKVWTSSPSNGPRQIAASRAKWGIDRYDLVQVHNLVAWKAHLKTLRAMKDAGQTRYIGITTSHGRRHDLVEQIMKTEPIDFIQVTYNIADRETGKRILPLAAEKGIAVIINRPYRRGGLIQATAGKPLPAWAPDIEATSWAQFLLKFVLSNPAVTVAIPATTRTDHVRENLHAAATRLPDAQQRRRMIDHMRTV